MNKRTAGILIAAVVLAALVVAIVTPGGARVIHASPAYAETGQSAYPPHASVDILDEDGNRIGPSSNKPYSPRQTCGACHDYDEINKSYHFQMGADQISDDYGAKIGKPWISSHGQFGRQQHMSYAWIAKKRNSASGDIGMTPYQYSQACGACHAGGGPMERDRDGQRYDQRQARHPQIADSRDGDYHKAAWDKSGVVEADCLMCHMPGYNAQARTDQLSKANFRWAATVGAGLGAVEGAVKDGQSPSLTYNRALFAGDGKVALKIARSEDANCLLCHGEAEVKKRGHVWYDGRQSDVHTAAGMKCITCHTSKPDHQIRKGHSHGVVLHDELDDPTLSCEGCHLSPKSTKKPAHKSLPKSHMATIACVTCHVTEQNVAAVGVVDTTTGKGLGLPTVKGAKKYGETGTWTPAYFRLKDGKIYSGNALLPSWWGNRVGGAIHPLTFAQTQTAFERVKSAIKDDNGDGKPEANTKAEIAAMLRAVAGILEVGQHGQISPAYIKGDKVWETTRGTLVTRKYEQASPLYWVFSHNVSPVSKALGRNGCADCHSRDSKFFNAPVLVDPCDLQGNGATVPMWQYCRVKKDVIEAGR